MATLTTVIVTSVVWIFLWWLSEKSPPAEYQVWVYSDGSYPPLAKGDKVIGKPYKDQHGYTVVTVRVDDKSTLTEKAFREYMRRMNHLQKVVKK